MARRALRREHESRRSCHIAATQPARSLSTPVASSATTRPGHPHLRSMAAPVPPPTLTLAQAEEAIGKIVAALEEPTTKAKLTALVAEVNAMPPEQQGMQKMIKILPAVQEATAGVLAEYGFDKANSMAFLMQMKAKAMESPTVKAGVDKLTDAMAGKV